MTYIKTTKQEACLCSLPSSRSNLLCISLAVVRPTIWSTQAAGVRGECTADKREGSREPQTDWASVGGPQFEAMALNICEIMKIWSYVLAIRAGREMKRQTTVVHAWLINPMTGTQSHAVSVGILMWMHWKKTCRLQMLNLFYVHVQILSWGRGYTK